MEEKLTENQIKQLNIIVESLFTNFMPNHMRDKNNIEINYINNRLGIKFKNKNIFISDIINRLELIEVPSIITDYYPEITNDNWILAIHTVLAGLTLNSGTFKRLIENKVK